MHQTISEDENEACTVLTLATIDDKKLDKLLEIDPAVPHKASSAEQLTVASNHFDKQFTEFFLYGLSQILQLAALDDMVDVVKQVHESCKVSLDTLNDLLTFDKIDENKLVVEVEEVDPWVLLLDTAKPFEINAKEANVAFSINCVDASTNWTYWNFIKADRFKLSQVIRNLISNSLKFTPPLGSVKVKVERIPIRQSTLNTLNSSTAIRISVQDSGAGISSDNQKKLFGQYVQFNAAALQQGKGSGLGLWISRSK